MAEARAVLRFVRVAPRKARPVVDMIRGQEVPMALAMLKHLPRHAAKRDREGAAVGRRQRRTEGIGRQRVDAGLEGVRQLRPDL